MTATVEESPDQHVWTLSGHRVTQFCVDPGACRLHSWSLKDSLDIRLGVPFQLTLADGTSREIDPELPEQLAPLLTLVGREINGFVVTRAGSLRVQLSDGSVIDVSPNPRYEAFEVNGGGSLEGLAYRAHPSGGAPWSA